MANELQAHSPLSRTRGVHEEVTDSLRRIGNKFNQIVIDTMDESRAHKTRATEWETRHHDVVTENNAFRAHNEELKRLLELSQPDVGSAIEGRDAAYRKLGHVRRVMRDLLVDLAVTQLPSLSNYVPELKVYRRLMLEIVRMKALRYCYRQSLSHDTERLVPPRPLRSRVAETMGPLTALVLAILRARHLRERNVARSKPRRLCRFHLQPRLHTLAHQE
ncbi:uncharacterized protein BJ212DRAFT_228577 [Suillus subaureus]|uniref:Uncharacterized protein n=1 Tax=Suillus subaureus TaxID=48587 RepID=A0A9P7EA18_9AGAM|nr:uncharacterized protein BJ212DRAFT_228577 [Suillus subaureus]KAG1815595.1 hypothetical protein BJ212DRAFT_228577 [Suillus subaureus]